MKAKDKKLIESAAQKIKPITSLELVTIKKAFQMKLIENNKTIGQFCSENGIKNQSLISNVLSGTGRSDATLSLIARYVLDDSWK